MNIKKNEYLPKTITLIEQSLNDLKKTYDVYINFHDVIGLSLIDQEISRVLNPYAYHHNSYCNHIKSTPDGFHQCIKQKNKALHHAFKIQEPFWGHCYADFHELVIPIIIKNHYIGALFIGNNILSIANYPMFYRDLKIITLMFETLFYDYEKYLITRTEDTSYRAKNYIVTTMSFIKDNFNQDLSLSLLAKNAFCNPTYLSSQFKKITNITLNQYITNIRIQESLYYLESTHLSITNIALKVGFSDGSYYSKKFKEQMHVTPMQYRKDSNV